MAKKTIFNAKAISEQLPDVFGSSYTRHNKVNYFLQGFDESLTPEYVEAVEDLIDGQYNEIKARLKALRKLHQALKKAS